ncbi:flagellar basal-body rod protein FlgB [Acidisarcina polymorpha]|uniref:Flagellar basal body rod protein FlgB n=1 Tax=Acidisarcina polymorpha TaxID=2211140 RepID=A0A2Z5FST0_9BACT|nr:flagellar biosynthesis protein FlgB [Acidisarcina polymorpha]AXC09526.1 flagellar basal-body rod protein FlgB [Acidisarcina polymorpha]
MHISTPLSGELGQYLDLSSAELKLTAANMANLDTPGYRTQGFDFASEMQTAVAEAQWGKPGGESGPSDPMSVPRPRDVDGLLERPDGNNVSMDREGLKMAESQLQFRTGIELLKREYSRVSDAIHSDK